MSVRRHAAFAVTLVLVMVPSVLGQTLPRPLKLDPSIYFGAFQFNGPGARAIAMGTAFIAVADDATASEWNPAGLHVILKPEVSLQLKRTTYDAPLLVPFSNTFGKNDEEVSSFAYASYAQSFGRFAFSIYRQELTSFRARGEFLTSGIPLYGTPDFDFRSSIDLDSRIVNYGTSGAVTFFESKLALGYSLRYGRLDVRSDIAEDFYKVADGRSTARVHDDDTDISFNAGLLWKPSRKLSFGAVYKSGPVFEVEQTQDFGAFVKPNPPNTFRERISVVVPDSFGAGLALRPTDQLTIAIDGVRVRYSDLNKEKELRATGILEGILVPAKDGTELHAGLEYVFLTKNPVSIRLGGYTEPDHRSIIALQGKKDTHYTGGLGFVVGSRFQLDLAANISDLANEYLVSTIFRWGR